MTKIQKAVTIAGTVHLQGTHAAKCQHPRTLLPKWCTLQREEVVSKRARREREREREREEVRLTKKLGGTPKPPPRRAAH